MNNIIKLIDIQSPYKEKFFSNINTMSGVLSNFNSSEFTAFPGFCDVHVHFREPGFSYKETIFSGSRAAAHGGYTAVCTMPNLNPVPDNAEHLKVQLELIKQNSCINIYPYGAITVLEKGEKLSDMQSMAKNVAGFSDDGHGVQRKEIMREAMALAKKLNRPIVAHCEDNTLLNGGYIHDGEYAKRNRHRGICSESEWVQVARDLELVEETGCAYHICHISTKETVELVRRAKSKGLDVTCETCPHYLILTDEDLQEDGRFKMNPPIRSHEDRAALIKGIQDGTIDMITTDHAPHTELEKSKGLEKSAFGIVGIEICFQLLYTHLVKNGILSLEKLIHLMAIAPRKRFNIPLGNDITVWKLSSEKEVDTNSFLSLGKSTPFSGETLFGECVLTICNGKIVYQ